MLVKTDEMVQENTEKKKKLLLSYLKLKRASKTDGTSQFTFKILL